MNSVLMQLWKSGAGGKVLFLTMLHLLELSLKLLEHALRDHLSDSTGMFVFIIIFFNYNESFTYKF